MTPLGLVALLGALASVIGYVRRPVRRRRATAQLVAGLGSWAVLWFAASSPFTRLGMMNLPDHMIGHVLVMFLVPMGLVASGCGRSWWWAVPVKLRRRWLRWWYVTRSIRVSPLVANPVAATLVLNAVMVSAHVPRVFDATMLHDWAMNWLMEPAFLLSGLFFFHYLIPSWHRPVRVRLRLQLFMVLSTMLEMLVVAMSMSIFTTAPWYSVMRMPSMPGMAYMPGMGLSASAAFHQQQLAAAILWICGDFWAVPCLVLIIRRLVVRDGGLLAALERQSSRLAGSGS